MERSDELTHYGVKGMRWGHRKRQSLSKEAIRKKKRIADARKEYRQAKRDFKEQKMVDKYKKHGLDYNADTVANVQGLGWKAAKRIENRIKNTNMSRFKAETIEIGRTAAIASVATVGTLSSAILMMNVLANVNQWEAAFG